MTDRRSFQEHWLNIAPKRMERYETMYRWNPATEHYYANARISSGQVIADFGCGPGHATIEFARRVGEAGHVHALDINDEFIRRARDRANREGLGDRITVHLLGDASLPLRDHCLDRVVARNTLIYVEDPAYTFSEFRRTLRKGGLAHTIEGDWRLTAVAPIPTAEWSAIIEAASWAWPWPEIGRNLHGHARCAGFPQVEVQILTKPDLDGRLKGMIDTVLGYARDSETMAAERIDRVADQIAQALREGTFLAIAPQFIVTATA